MKPSDHLRQNLSRIDGKGYKAYKEIQGSYTYGRFTLSIDHVQGDPFAQPSRLRVRVERKASGFALPLSHNTSRAIAFSDWLSRRFATATRRYAKGHRGSGKGGAILMDTPGQEILESTAMKVTDQWIEARFFLGLPAFGRRVAGRDATAMLLKKLPAIVEHALFADTLASHEIKAMEAHIEGFEDADALRHQLKEKSLVAFVANGSRLARASGIDPRPLTNGAIAFESPNSLAVTLKRPNGGEITGMGIPSGVTLIVGGGFHGKSTLLHALERGVYNHIPGDGREWVITDEMALKIRAADGRSITGTDISAFINNLPFGRPTTAFTTENASGSTSQAANICEGMEAGASTLLLDEDTSATNFMVRDHKMQQLVSADKEPITPFVHRVKELHRSKNISTILVMGGSGDYFAEADLVIRMTDYTPEDVTQEAHRIGAENQDAMREPLPPLPKTSPRRFKQGSIPMEERRGRVKVATYGLYEMVLGKTRIEFPDAEQLVSPSQTRALAEAVRMTAERFDGKKTLSEMIQMTDEGIQKKGLESLTDILRGDFAAFRPLELAMAINRARTLKI